ncbi:IclR family transcriptional regulator [Allonocardiopsis opalescens]|uniref:IclR family transcriptional regulator n=1 Tax=Allonocardiopsis opalescens TaxID=1144618 RepID=A0A2T0PUJ1_9ACTN|nr:IclR family transcriptional regulator [Allonocardiopsis opalescens]PRX92559.1 IclR family transcriptional regulator [Allonocardiopsis opalescens]
MPHVPAATRALAVLRHLAAQPGPVSASALARALGLPRSSVYQLLGAMAEQGFVTHLPEERRWALGITAFEIGSAYLRRDPLERLARPLLARLADDLGLTAHLGVLHGADTLYLLKEHPRHAPTLVTAVGVRLPAHLTASGRAQLARLPRAQVRALYPSADAFTSRTGAGPGGPTELRELLAAERRRGWSSEDGEVSPGYASVAVAAFDHGARPAAAISVTFDRRRHPPADWDWLARRVAVSAAELTRRLGGRTPAGPDGG